jgi:ATP-dependent DNA helicase RecG
MPSPLEKLQKFLKLEAEGGYANRAIIGGLDKILPWWEKDVLAAGYSPEFVEHVRGQLKLYSTLTPADRPAIVQDLFGQIQAVAPSAAPVVPTMPAKPAPPVVTQPVRAAESAPAAQVEEKPAATPSKAVEPEPKLVTRFDRPPAPPAPPVTQSQQPATPPAAATIDLDASVLQVPGVGKQNSQTLEDMGIRTIGELLYYFPRRYDDYSQLKPINRLAYQDELTVIGTIQTSSTRPIHGGKRKLTEAIISDGTGSLRLTWFNKPWLASKLQVGNQIVVSGKVDQYLGRLMMTEPDLEEVDQEHLHTNRITPVYPTTAQMAQKTLRRLMHKAVTFLAPRVGEFLPREIREAAALAPMPISLQQIHFPDSQEQLSAARNRLAFDEIFLLQLGVLKQKHAWQANTAQTFEVPDEWLAEQVGALPYSLTHAQQRVLAEIRHDLATGHPMNRLIQGDVGSGKTVVAALAAAILANNGAQVAVMAPTSILAEQHLKTFRRLLTEGPVAPLAPEAVELMIGDTSEAEKQRIRGGLADGSIQIIIGTHTLIEDPVTFNRLQLAIIDEQHRFGVQQRALLRMKGDNPHLLVMTATPIPRSLALTLYGDLDLSVMDEMPVGRQPIATYVLPPLERERAYQLIRSQVQKGRQAFIIYPLVEAGEEGGGLAAVEEHQNLQTKIFPNLRLGLLHGRLKPEEKEQVMTRFRQGEYDILVSTTVVEVGVDVPNATVMLIESANRFGLAQLHQLRGRVGRGAEQSYCLLIPETEDAVENERLQVMAETNDGFVLAERDLQQRGPGDFLGTRQAGFAELRLASLSDVRLIEKARQLGSELFQRDPNLNSPAYSQLKTRLESFWGGQGDIS